MNYLIYLAYGSEAIRCEACYSILSYYEQVGSPAPDTQILVYTDAAAAFQQILGSRPYISYPAVSPEQWQAWRGAANKVYLLKIGVLEHAAAHYPGNLLFLDTDTIWRRNPTPLFAAIAAGHFYMHQNEGRLINGNTLSRKVYRHLKTHEWEVAGHTFRVTPETELFNSGVIALRSDKAYLLREVMTLAEQLYATYNKHMMEQLAFSLRLAAEGPIADVPDYLWHYWNLKEARPALVQVFHTYGTHPSAELLARLHQLQLPRLHEQELAYRNLPGWRRALRKLVGRRWRLPPLEV
ncbi:hypothetical protein HNQ93_000533 [Hymenobacter luteus]|uniref:Nucleotide-diphospho-sugar transferase domain-containing protein n=2 Tax=Hymenobacter TaxID=89966 RepID=A0A7W9SYA2_9BACT|nr:MULTISPECIES: putative nucleotide-diphospho-sugar transferase [Hymenobacter]MBB4599987.1 hypothetical protein [Hymenobacter latericoloratus]MBB6057703.1 hypothetical protein [Hymenobacter luteus]